MNDYKIYFLIKANGTTVLWDIEDAAAIRANTAAEAEKKLREHCRLWSYPAPKIISIKKI